ncbi:MAG: hypothetical protein ACI8PZ_001890 [Myxococcota bacterium]|jgi:hypothetical protein
MSEVMWTEGVSAPVDAPPVRSVMLALAGFGVLGVCAAVGAPAAGAAAEAISTSLLVDAGALVLTAPALLVVHQYLGLAAEPGALIAVLARAFVTAGGIALGVAPCMLVFSATSGLALAVFVLLLLLVGAAGLRVAWRDLLAAEPAGAQVSLWKMRGLVLGWAVLASAIGVRIGWDLLPGGL